MSKAFMSSKGYEQQDKERQAIIRLRSARKVYREKVSSIHLLELTTEFLNEKVTPEVFRAHLVLLGYSVNDVLDFADSLFYLADRSK